MAGIWFRREIEELVKQDVPEAVEWYERLYKQSNFEVGEHSAGGLASTLIVEGEGFVPYAQQFVEFLDRWIGKGEYVARYFTEEGVTVFQLRPVELLEKGKEDEFVDDECSLESWDIIAKACRRTAEPARVTHWHIEQMLSAWAYVGGPSLLIIPMKDIPEEKWDLFEQRILEVVKEAAGLDDPVWLDEWWDEGVRAILKEFVTELNRGSLDGGGW